MKKIIVYFLSLLATSAVFAGNIMLDNETIHPASDPKTKMAIQWATTAKEVQQSNNALNNGLKLDQNSLQVLSQPGKIPLIVPKDAEYFRVLVWSTAQGAPDLLTNWVSVIANKTYTLKNDQLVPAVLMLGTGC